MICRFDMGIQLNTPLSIKDIDFRVQSINIGKYATILAYKDARVDMNRLDDAVGRLNWQKKYDTVNGNLFCSVGIYDESKKEWIWKQDVGTESQTEKEKGEASDSFKRACFNWGIGRELYNYPIIQVHLKNTECVEENGKMKPTFDFKLKQWVWDLQAGANGEINLLSCKDELGVERFCYTKEGGVKKIYAQNQQSPPQQPQQQIPTKQALPRLTIGSSEFVKCVDYLKNGHKKPSDGTHVDVSIDDLKRQFTIGSEVEEALKSETLKI